MFPGLNFLIFLTSDRLFALIHIVENLTDYELLQLWDENLAKFARVDVTQEVVGANLSRLALEQDLDDLEGRLLENDHVLSLVFGELEPIDEVLEGKEKV